jgi:single-strand DNA-binding protein
VNGRQQDAGGNWVDKPNFFDVKVFGNQAELLSQHLAKGRRIGVDGRLDWSSWEQEGAKRSKVEVIAQSVQFLDSRSDGEGGGSSGSYLPPQAAGQSGGSGSGSDADFPSTPADDDIPF